jgi:CheY-like chemotaxis protein
VASRPRRTDRSRRPPLILIVEDDAETRGLLRTLLGEELGARVSEAADGAAALRSVVGARPDLVLLDLALPVFSGLQVCRRLKADPAAAAIPLVVVSGAVRAPGRPSEQLPYDAFLAKPVDAGELVAVARRCLDAGRRDGPSEPRS